MRHTDFPASSRPTAANIVVQYFLTSGPEDYAFERNSTRLGADLGSVESIILSHGHWDHAGATFLALGAIRARNGGREVPYYAHPAMFHSRGIKLSNGSVRLMDDVPAIDELAAQGAGHLHN